MSRFVVIGGSGFLGSWFVESLAAEGPTTIYDTRPPAAGTSVNVTYEAGDVLDRQRLTQVLRGADEVYNLAGMLGTSELLRAGIPATEVNVIGTISVLEACLEAGVTRIFRPAKGNIHWLNTYSITSAAAEQFSLMYRQQFGLDVSLLRLFNVFGPRQRCYPIRKVVPTLVLQALYGRPMTVYGSGEQVMDLTDVADVARLSIAYVRSSLRPAGIPDLGRGLPIRVNELAEMVRLLTRSASPIEHLAMRPGEPENDHTIADLTLLRPLLAGEEFRNLDESLNQTVAYYREMPASQVRSFFAVLE